MENLGEKLFELRKSKNLTQDDVAEKLNVTRQTVSKWETNQSTPDFDKIVPLCDLYGITPNELLSVGNGESTNANQEETDMNEAKNHLFTRGKDDKLDYENMTASQIKHICIYLYCSSCFFNDINSSPKDEPNNCFISVFVINRMGNSKNNKTLYVYS